MKKMGEATENGVNLENVVEHPVEHGVKIEVVIEHCVEHNVKDIESEQVVYNTNPTSNDRVLCQLCGKSMVKRNLALHLRTTCKNARVGGS